MDISVNKYASLKKSSFWLSALTALFLLSGCGMTVSNLTPVTYPENPSNLYTLSTEVDTGNIRVVDNSVSVSIIIDGEKRPMRESAVRSGIWEYDYAMPPGRTDAVYYFEVDFIRQTASGSRPETFKSGLQKLTVANRFAVSLESSRGPVGATITVFGRGFSNFDQISVGGVDANTTYISPNALAFSVPALDAGRTYPVSVSGSRGEIAAGSFTIDSGTIRVVPSQLSLSQGGRSTLVFTLSAEAPANGLILDITTDIPESIGLGMVQIPAGSRSVSAMVEGLQSGNGNLFVTAPGFNEVVIPVSVR